MAFCNTQHTPSSSRNTLRQMHFLEKLPNQVPQHSECFLKELSPIFQPGTWLYFLKANTNSLFAESKYIYSKCQKSSFVMDSFSGIARLRQELEQVQSIFQIYNRFLLDVILAQMSNAKSFCRKRHILTTSKKNLRFCKKKLKTQ